jgi:hypothetical protein
MAAIDRVMKKIERITESGCWIFMGALNTAGYGIVGKDGGRGSGNDRAHRITFSYFKGEIPTNMFVCHHCDIPACCNPEHLFLGTPLDNHLDMEKKNRGKAPPRNYHDNGEYRYNSKLTESLVIEYRDRKSKGETTYSLWKECNNKNFKISMRVFYRAVRGDSWRHV